MSKNEPNKELDRTPPAAIRRALRREVGFGCPVPGCGSPFLEWHHFDPPWHERKHHETAGMIALCSNHHPKADAGAYTVEQLRKFKADAAASRSKIETQFGWLRHRLIVQAGGNFVIDTMTVVSIGGQPAIWLTRDDDGHLLLNLNLNLLSKSKSPRAQMEDGFWTSPVGEIDDLSCPPNGRILDIKYKNGDRYRIEFFDVLDGEDALKRYAFPPSGMVLAGMAPFVGLEINCTIADSNVRLSSAGTEAGGGFSGANFAVNCAAAINIDSI